MASWSSELKYCRKEGVPYFEKHNGKDSGVCMSGLKSILDEGIHWYADSMK